MSAKFSGVKLISKGEKILDWDRISVDVETGYLWWKKKKRIELVGRCMDGWTYPDTGELEYDFNHSLKAAVRLCELSGGFDDDSE